MKPSQIQQLLDERRLAAMEAGWLQDLGEHTYRGCGPSKHCPWISPCGLRACVDANGCELDRMAGRK